MGKTKILAMLIAFLFCVYCMVSVINADMTGQINVFPFPLAINTERARSSLRGRSPPLLLYYLQILSIIKQNRGKEGRSH